MSCSRLASSNTRKAQRPPRATKVLTLSLHDQTKPWKSRSGSHLAETGWHAADSVASRFIRARRPAVDVGGNFVNAKILGWLKECHHEHRWCTAKTSPRLPTRVLDVGDIADTSDVSLHISQPGEQADYTTLSYCWGNSYPDVITTTGTLAGMTQGIKFSRLSRTI